MTTQTQSPQRGSESTQRRGRSWAWPAATPSRAPDTWLKPSKTEAQPGHQVSITECDLSPQAELSSEALIELLTHKIVRYKKSITWSKVSWTQVRNLFKEEPNDQTPTVMAGYWPVKTLIPLFWVQWILSPARPGAPSEEGNSRLYPCHGWGCKVLSLDQRLEANRISLVQSGLDDVGMLPPSYCFFT